MSTSLQLRRGTTAEHTAFTGLNAEITVDTGLKSIRLHDGVTPGGTIIGGSVITNTHRNRLRNSSFTVNQRTVSGTVTLTAGQYGHDGFKGGASGCTYTFSSTGNVVTLTITAGTLMQVIAGSTLQTGVHILTYGGTAQSRVNAGVWGASGAVFSITGGTNTTVEWHTGTLTTPQFEPGSVGTIFEIRDDELQRCRRFYRKSYPQGTAPGAVSSVGHLCARALGAGAVIELGTSFDTPMYASPAVVYYNPATGTSGQVYNLSNPTNIAVSTIYFTADSHTGVPILSAPTVAGDLYIAHYTASAEL